jgi:peptide/nickel transport system permease protein
MAVPQIRDLPSAEGLTSEDAAVRSPMAKVWAALRGNKMAFLGLVVLVVLVILSIFAPLIAPYPVNQQVGQPFAAPSMHHILGLDDAGYDVFSLLLYGLRISLLVGFSATVIASVVGTVIGIIAGYRGGIIDNLLMRLTDYFLVIPLLPLMIVVADLWGATLVHIIAVIGLLSWTMTAIVIRAQVRSLREYMFIRRARATGASHTRIIVQHILPQVMPLVVANTVLNISYAVFTETALAFLGIGDPSQVSLGTMIEFGFQRGAIAVGAWWAIVPPGLLVTIIVLACSLIGRGIEDSFNPRLNLAHLSMRRPRVVAAPVASPGGQEGGARGASA